MHPQLPAQPNTGANVERRHNGDLRTPCDVCGEFHWGSDERFIAEAETREMERLDRAFEHGASGEISWEEAGREAWILPPPDGLAQKEARWAARNLPPPWWRGEASGLEARMLELSPLFPGDGSAIPLAPTEWLEDLAREWVRLHRAYPTPWLRRFGYQLRDELERRQTSEQPA